jgi:Chaperone of endosialidase
MSLPISVTYTFATATSSIPLSQLDANFTTVVNGINGIGNGTNALANVNITGGNATVSSLTSPTLNSSTTLSLQTGGTTGLYIDGSQNVGIGTTSPGEKLQVAGGLRLTGTLSGAQASSIGIDYSSAARIISYGANTSTQGSFAFLISNSNASTTNQAVTIDSSGNVGIGTSSPGVKLDVNGAIKTSSTLNIYYSGKSGLLINEDSSSNVYINQQDNGPMIFNTNNAERMRIDSSGNLLVGTTSFPSSSATTGSGVGLQSTTILINSNTSGASFYINKTSSSGGTYFTSFQINGSNQGAIYSSGSGVAYLTSSDYRLKTNVTPLTTAQSGPIIDALKPSQFTWTTDNTTDVGFIAHEMQAVIPRAVNGEKDAVDAEGKPVYQQVAVSSPEIIAYLVAELQSVRSRLAGLESTVATQATEITTLKAKVGA